CDRIAGHLKEHGHGLRPEGHAAKRLIVRCELETLRGAHLRKSELGKGGGQNCGGDLQAELRHGDSHYVEIRDVRRSAGSGRIMRWTQEAGQATQCYEDHRTSLSVVMICCLRLS